MGNPGCSSCSRAAPRRVLLDWQPARSFSASLPPQPPAGRLSWTDFQPGLMPQLMDALSPERQRWAVRRPRVRLLEGQRQPVFPRSRPVGEPRAGRQHDGPDPPAAPRTAGTAMQRRGQDSRNSTPVSGSSAPAVAGVPADARDAVAAADLRAPRSRRCADGLRGRARGGGCRPLRSRGRPPSLCERAFSLPSWHRKLARAKAHGHYGPDVELEPIGPPLPGSRTCDPTAERPTRSAGSGSSGRPTATPPGRTPSSPAGRRLIRSDGSAMESEDVTLEELSSRCRPTLGSSG